MLMPFSSIKPKKRVSEKRLGQILIDQGIISRNNLDEALALQESTEVSVYCGELLLSLGYVNENNILQALNAQYRFPYININNYEIDYKVISLVPFEIAHKYLLLPLDKIGNSFSVAMSNPLNTHAIRELKELEGLSCCNIQIFISTPTEIRNSINIYYYETSLGNGI